MLDTVINGTRTSRSILGNLSISEDWSLARAQLVGEGWPIDFGPLNPAGLSQKGTDLNKNTLLTDATEQEIFGSTADRTVDDALNRLRAQIVSAQNTANSKSFIAKGNYYGSGGYGATSPNSLTFGFVPKVVFVALSDAAHTGIFIKDTGTTAGTGSNSNIYLAWSGNAVTWYSTSANTQFNISGRNYNYVALG